MPVSVVNPACVRHFAQAQGLRPAPTPLPDAVLTELRERVRWRQFLKEQLVATGNRAAHGTTGFVARQQARLVRHLEKQVAAVDAEPAAALQRSPHWQAQIRKLTELDGIGQITALATLSQMPGPGRLNRREAAALADLGPWTRQSGPWEGQRHIGGGRPEIRRALHMAAVAVARMARSTLGRFYQHLRAKGRPAKLALTAVMRKLLLQMHHTLKPT